MKARSAAISDADLLSERPLGKLLSTHRAPRSLKFVALFGGPLLLALGLLMFVGALDPDPKQPLAVRFFLTLAGASFGALGAAVLVVLRRKQATLVQLYEGGIVELNGKKRRTLAWEDVLSFQRSASIAVEWLGRAAPTGVAAGDHHLRNAARSGGASSLPTTYGLRSEDMAGYCNHTLVPAVLVTGASPRACSPMEAA